MLRWPRALALRAVTALLAVHVLTLVVGLGFGVLEGRTTRLGGADVAFELALKDLRYQDGGWVVARDGAFGALAARNPGLWVVGGGEGAPLLFGPVPASARRLVGIDAPASVDAARDDLGAWLPDAVVERHRVDGRSILLVAGGVDPATVTRLDVLRTFSFEPALALFVGWGVLGAIALFLAVPLVRGAVRPVVQDAASIGPHDVGRRLDERRAPVELLPLARALNGALDRLETELGRRKRLISNVAHELRTPLAVLSLRVDTLAAPADEREGLRTAVGCVTRLVEQMLDLERLSLPTGPRVAVDLTELAREVVAALAPMAVNAGYDLSLDAAPAPVVVSGERQAVERAVTNLVRNAIDHGGGRGLIRVVVGDAWLEVADQGPGIPAELAPRLFDAFARGPGEAGGSGLGLHLTREIMRGLGGEVVWRRDASGTTFRLQFSPQDVSAPPA